MDSKEASFTFSQKRAFLKSTKDPLSSISISGFCKEARKIRKKEKKWDKCQTLLWGLSQVYPVRTVFPKSPNNTQLGKIKNTQVPKPLHGDCEQQVREAQKSFFNKHQVILIFRKIWETLQHSTVSQDPRQGNKKICTSHTLSLEKGWNGTSKLSELHSSIITFAPMSRKRRKA